VFAGGFTGIAHYNGTTWSESPDIEDIDISADGIWGSSGTDVYAVGSYWHQGAKSHYNGINWSTTLTEETYISYSDIWGSSPSDIWVTGNAYLVGTGDYIGFMEHFNGTSWSQSGFYYNKHLYGVWGSLVSDVFIVGDSGLIIHYNGSSWSSMTSGTANTLHDIWGSSGNDVFAVGNNGTILHYNGSDWSSMTSGTTVDLYGVWGSSGSDVFAVGYDDSNYTSIILHYAEPQTYIALSSFIVTPSHKEVAISWSTESEIDNAGFNIYRAEAEDGEYVQINDALIPAEGSSIQGAAYQFNDENVKNRKTYYYKLEDIDLNGVSTMHGPVSAVPRLINVFR